MVKAQILTSINKKVITSDNLYLSEVMKTFFYMCLYTLSLFLFFYESRICWRKSSNFKFSAILIPFFRNNAEPDKVPAVFYNCKQFDVSVLTAVAHIWMFFNIYQFH